VIVPWERASRKRGAELPVIRNAVAAALVAYAGRMRRNTAEPVAKVRAKIKATGDSTWKRVMADATLHAAPAALDARVESRVGARPSRLIRGVVIDPAATMPGTLTEVAAALGLSRGTVWRRRKGWRERSR